MQSKPADFMNTCHSLSAPSVHIISPSGAINPQYIDSAAERLKSWGCQVSEGQYTRGKEGRFAGTQAQRLEDLKTAFSLDSIEYILCSRGGYGLQQILDRLPVTCLPTLVGFSDITCLHSLMSLHGKPSLHGLMCKHLAEWEEDDSSIQYWKDAIMGNPLHYDLPSYSLQREGQTSGVLIGGNLSVLYGLQGTPYSLEQIGAYYRQKGTKTILFIEDIAERHYHIDRMMQNLRMSGVLSQIGGLIVGQFSDTEDDPSMGETVYETIFRAVEDYHYPVWMNFPSGHSHPNYPLWLGRTANICVSSTECHIDWNEHQS